MLLRRSLNTDDGCSEADDDMSSRASTQGGLTWHEKAAEAARLRMYRQEQKRKREEDRASAAAAAQSRREEELRRRLQIIPSMQLPTPDEAHNAVSAALTCMRMRASQHMHEQHIQEVERQLEEATVQVAVLRESVCRSQRDARLLDDAKRRISALEENLEQLYARHGGRTNSAVLNRSSSGKKQQALASKQYDEWHARMLPVWKQQRAQARAWAARYHVWKPPQSVVLNLRELEKPPHLRTMHMRPPTCPALRIPGRDGVPIEEEAEYHPFL